MSRQLTSLSLSFSGVSTESLALLAPRLSELVSLDLSGCYDASDDGGTSVSVYVGLARLAAHGKLRRLCLRGLPFSQLAEDEACCTLLATALQPLTGELEELDVRGWRMSSSLEEEAEVMLRPLMRPGGLLLVGDGFENELFIHEGEEETVGGWGDSCTPKWCGCGQPDADGGWPTLMTVLLEAGTSMMAHAMHNNDDDRSHALCLVGQRFAVVAFLNPGDGDWPMEMASTLRWADSVSTARLSQPEVVE